MIYDGIKIIWTALSASFQMADRLFTGVGIALVTAVTVMVLVSSVLRLFTARFIGTQINIGRDRVAARDAKQARETARREKAETQRLRIQSGKEVL